MYKNHCKKQYSARLPSSCSTINDTRPLQKTVRRALPLFSHLTFFRPPIKKWCKTIAKNSTSCSHTFFLCHLSLLLTPAPIAKPLQNHCKNIISWSSNCLPRPLLLFGFLSSHAALSTCPNAGSTRPKTGATWLQAGPRRPKTCATWPKTAL